MRQVVILDLKINKTKNNGVLYCSLRDHATGELIISADLSYIMRAISERGFELVDAQDVLFKVSQMALFYSKAAL